MALLLLWWRVVVLSLAYRTVDVRGAPKALVRGAARDVWLRGAGAV